MRIPVVFGWTTFTDVDDIGDPDRDSIEEASATTKQRLPEVPKRRLLIEQLRFFHAPTDVKLLVAPGGI